MKRHISIFTFLLGAFAATVVQAAADTQAVYGGYYFVEHGPSGAFSSQRMRLKGEYSKSNIEIQEGGTATFVAYPEKGLEVTQWGSFTLGKGDRYPSDANKYAKYTWSDSKSDSKDWSGKPADGDGYLAVNFDYIPFEITFDRNGGEGEMKPIAGLNIISNAITLTSCAFTRTGYEMVGWSNAVYWAAHQPPVIGDGATVRGEDFWDDAEGEFGEGNKVTLTALWEPNTYTVHFEGNGATSGSMNDQTFTYDEDAKELSANAFRKENHVFAGWATNKTLGVIVYQDKQKVRNLTAEKDGTVNLYARWTPMHKVTFKEHAMFGGGLLKVDHVEDGKDAEPPSDPEHDGFKFLGWSKGITNVRQDLEVTAEYEGTPYYVVYHANDGSDRTTQQEFKHGVEKPLAGSTTFLRTGHTLKGWMVDATSTAPDYECGTPVLNLTMEDSFDLYAFWKPIPYTVAFDGNGGEGTMEPIPLDYGAPFEVPECGFKKTGCEFRSWQVLVNKVVVTNYPAGVTVSNLTSKAGDTVTFRADWIGRYTVAFDGNDGEGTMTNVTYETGVEYALPSNAFTKTGYGFYGWATSKADADALRKPAYTNGETVVDLVAAGGTRTLFAEWTTNRYTVVFNPNWETAQTMANQPFIYDQPQNLSSNDFKRGELWSFAGWSNSVGRVFTDGESVSNLCADDNGTVELFARWASELGPLSEAMGCDNLKWISDYDRVEKEDLYAWEVCTTNGFGGSCAEFVHELKSRWESSMHANIGTNGTLTFRWQPSDGSAKLVVYLVRGNVAVEPPLKSVAGTAGKWSDEVEVSVPEFDDGDQLKIVLTKGTCFVDQMTWVPDGAHPVPGPGDAVEIKTAAVSDGKFILSFPSDARFDYNLLTNANLLINSWGIMDTFVGDGSIHTFDPQIIEGQPQLFYKVETIRKKD